MNFTFDLAANINVQEDSNADQAEKNIKDAFADPVMINMLAQYGIDINAVTVALQEDVINYPADKDDDDSTPYFSRIQRVNHELQKGFYLTVTRESESADINMWVDRSEPLSPRIIVTLDNEDDFLQAAVNSNELTAPAL